VDVSISEQSPAHGRIGRILVVEDDPSTARSLASILDRAGYQTAVCHNGSAALHTARELRPSAAMVDIHLPDLSGLILTQKLREQLGPDVPIIVVSGDTSMETLNSLSHVGATYFLSKPIPANILLQMLGACLGEAGRRAS
jgi:DNA-binding response OmpR family regulator